ncbi:hypothetical protein [Hoeflea alexandrii]|uniref:hypothetical protein n=1 Tax=Hoeflea alexandrii TaxID=288436 RepID=UPI0022AF6E52|nr:hypothetical protein [Hoeflea alexandrii]MCZ4287243.1 hypothetical protein [Hoeflea alexandrii]
MSKPQPTRNPFAKRVLPPALAAQVIQTRPASTHGRVILFKTREDGTVYEDFGRPLFLYIDKNSLTAKYNLPDGRYLQGSPEHLAKRAELGIN